MKILGIDYVESRTGFAITDGFNITVQGLETVYNNGSDKIILKKIDELLEKYEIDTIVIGMPYNMDGTISKRAEITEKFIHEFIDERRTTVAAHKTMNFLNINKHKKRDLVDTIAAVYILETYLNKKNAKP